MPYNNRITIAVPTSLNKEMRKAVDRGDFLNMSCLVRTAVRNQLKKTRLRERDNENVKEMIEAEVA